MHNAPAVNYPVGRSHFQGWLVALTGLTGGVTGLLWCEQADLVGWRQGLFAIGLLATCLWAIQAWRSTPHGHLRWDGKIWRWTSGQVSISGHLTIHLDLQFVLLLSLRSDTGPRLWLWPERRDDLVRWRALRQAVFSRRASVPAQEADTDVLTGSSR